MRSALVTSCACALLAVAGCTPSPLDQSWQEPRPLGAELPAYRPPRVPAAADPSARPAMALDDPLQLNDALAAALMHNPDLASFAWDVRIAEARALQAGLWPNPELEAETEGIAQNGDAFGLSETTIRLTQPILTANKLAKRRRVADFGSELAAWDYEAARLDVLTTVVQRYVDVLATARVVTVNEQSLALAEQVFETVSRLVDAGEISSIERRRAAVELSEARIALQQAHRGLRSARAGLAGAIGLVDAPLGEVEGELPAPTDVPPLETLLPLLEMNPAVARWEAETAQRKARVSLARAQAVPDINVGVGLQRFDETDDYAGVISFGLPLPIFNRNQGEVLEARFDLAKARAQRHAAVVAVRVELTQAYQDMQAAREEIQLLQEEALPAARSAYEDIRTAYRQGGRPLLDVLDAQRTHFALEARHVAALADYHQSAAQLERLVGQTLESITEEPAADFAEPEHTNEE